MLYGKALEVALKSISPEAKGTLEQRIDKLVDNHTLTPAIGTWAHQIRVLRNDSTHEIEALPRPELVSLRSFTNLVMQYVFTLPKMVADKITK